MAKKTKSRAIRTPATRRYTIAKPTPCWPLLAVLLVLVPLYHPYVRLLVPLAPGAICLALMVVSHVLPMSNNLGGGVRQPLRVSPTWMQGGILIASLTLVLIAELAIRSAYGPRRACGVAGPVREGTSSSRLSCLTARLHHRW